MSERNKFMISGWSHLIDATITTAERLHAEGDEFTPWVMEGVERIVLLSNALKIVSQISDEDYLEGSKKFDQKELESGADLNVVPEEIL